MVVLLTAFGKRGYGYAAHNLALSLRYHGCKFPIYLYAQRETVEGINFALFDRVDYLEERELKLKGRFAPGYAKVNAIAKIPSDEVLYIDVDSFCLKSIEPLVEKLREKDFSTIYMGEGYYKQDISYDPWANHEYAFPYFGLDINSKWTTVQTSMVWYRDTPKTREILNDLKYYFEKGYASHGMKESWAGQYVPDELIFSGVIAKHGIDIKMNCEPVFFGVKNNPDRSLERHQIEDKYYFLSMLGGAGSRAITLPKFQEWYTGLGMTAAKKEQVQFFNHKYVMIDKLYNR